MRKRQLCLIALALAPSPGTAQDARPPESLAFAEFGRAFLQRLGETEALSLTALLERHYDRSLLGDFDLRVPRSMTATKDGVATVAAIATVLLEAQVRLTEWTPVEKDAVTARHKELLAQKKRVAAWHDKPVAPAVSDLFAADPCVLILAPDRRAFVGFIGWLGMWKQVYRDFWWIVPDQAGTRKQVVSAPFLGTDAFARELVPAEFLDDHLEFHRAYRAAFVHWLATKGAKAKQAAQERVRELLRRMMDPAETAGFEALCGQLYGVPLSSADPERDTLERRFLAWIARG